MEQMQWFLMGVIFTLSVLGLAYLSILVKLEWYTWLSLISGVIFILFGIGWAGASYMEGYPQSGAMALTIFSGWGGIQLTLTWRHLVAPLLTGQKG
jgi:hypothetical protein